MGNNDNYQSDLIEEFEEEDFEEEDFEEDDTELEALEREEQFLCVSKRLKALIREVATQEGCKINFGRGSVKKLQDTINFLTVALTYELIQILDKNNKIRITPSFVDNALSNLFKQADAYGIVLTELNKLIENFSKLNESSSFAKATEFVNIKDIKKEV
jgi:hypothetical protein